MPAPSTDSSRSSPLRRRWALGLALALHLLSGGWLLSSRGIGQYFYDERFTLENVRRIALQGHPVPTSYFWYAPLSYVPQASALLAIDRLGRALGTERLATLQPQGVPTRLGIRIARAFGILFGCLTLVALHALVRRLWDAPSADFAVVALGASPWFTRGNAEFKPDALLVLLSVAVFVPLLRYMLDGAAGGRRLAAVVAGAAAAAKLNGVFAVVPLGIACWLEPTWRRRLTVTLETAAIAVASFLILNPWPRSALYYLGRVESQWAVRQQDLDFLGMLATMLGKLFKVTYLGPLFGVAAAAGLLLALAGLRTGAGEPRRRLARALWLVYPTVYLVFLCASTRYPKENNLLPALPFAASLAGVALAALAAYGMRHAPRLARALLPAAALLGTVTLARFVILETTAQHADVQVRQVRRELGGSGYGRIVAWWGGDDAMREFARSGWSGPPPLLVPLDLGLTRDTTRVERLDCVGGHGSPGETLEGALAARFPLRRYGEGPLGSRLFQRTARPWHGCRPWQRVGGPVDLVFERLDEEWYAASIPAALPPFDAFTLNGRVRIEPHPVEIEIADRPFPARAIGSARQRWLLLGSERSIVPIAGASLRVRSRFAMPPNLEILLWARPGDGPADPVAGEDASPTDGSTDSVDESG
jgi:4-amino-4-deoxy-L-arabinose transferase-like glycosyltransferase